MCEIQEARKAGYGIKGKIYGRDSHLKLGAKGCSGYKTINIYAVFTVAINKNILRKTNK